MLNMVNQVCLRIRHLVLLTAIVTAEPMIRNGIRWTQWDDRSDILHEITRHSTR